MSGTRIIGFMLFWYGKFTSTHHILLHCNTWPDRNLRPFFSKRVQSVPPQSSSSTVFKCSGTIFRFELMYWSEMHGPSLTAKLNSCDRCPSCRHANRNEYSMMRGVIQIAYLYTVRAKCTCFNCFPFVPWATFRDSPNTFPLYWSEQIQLSNILITFFISSSVVLVLICHQ